MRHLTAILFTLALLGLPGAAMAGAREPVVVELFTSQGCPACPEAEAFMRELARRDDIVALEFHIDYFDYAGWKDPFGDADHTRRWRGYAQSLGARYEYTPFMVIGGRTHVVGSDREAAEEGIRASQRIAGARPGLTVEANRQRATIDVRGQGPTGIFDILLVTYDREHRTRVTNGENNGKTLIEANVVRGFRRVGQWAGEPVRLEVDLAGMPGDGGSVVLLQRTGGGPILTAAAVDF